MMKPKLIK